jgi:hypothetical protein
MFPFDLDLLTLTGSDKCQMLNVRGLLVVTHELWLSKASI